MIISRICYLCLLLILPVASFAYAEYHYSDGTTICIPEDRVVLEGGSMFTARTKCYYIQLVEGADCPDYAFGHSTMKKGTPLSVICANAKRAAAAPRGCQRKHCTPCTYYD